MIGKTTQAWTLWRSAAAAYCMQELTAAGNSKSQMSNGLIFTNVFLPSLPISPARQPLKTTLACALKINSCKFISLYGTSLADSTIATHTKQRQCTEFWLVESQLVQHVAWPGSHKYDPLVKRQKSGRTTNHARNYVGWGLFFEQFFTSAVTILW
jgi:hypothetical protein